MINIIIVIIINIVILTLTLTLTLTIIGANISMVGVAPRVDRIYVGNNPLGGEYSAGDSVPICIEFSDDVYVTYSGDR
jgi:hypothetical protein